MSKKLKKGTNYLDYYFIFLDKYIKMIKCSLAIVILVSMCFSSFAQQYGSFKDTRDGRVYKTIKIGSQVWMAENLNAFKFRNGDVIPIAKLFDQWGEAFYERKPACSYYENNGKYGNMFGLLYNGYAINDPRGIAPPGWHIPSEAEWKILINYLGGSPGEIMRSDTLWNEYIDWVECSKCKNWPQEKKASEMCGICEDTRRESGVVLANGSNLSGFNALPSGTRKWDRSDEFDGLGTMAIWWTSTLHTRGLSKVQIERGQNDLLISFSEFYNGFSVRCIKD